MPNINLFIINSYKGSFSFPRGCLLNWKDLEIPLSYGNTSELRKYLWITFHGIFTIVFAFLKDCALIGHGSLIICAQLENCFLWRNLMTFSLMKSLGKEQVLFCTKSSAIWQERKVSSERCGKMHQMQFCAVFPNVFSTVSWVEDWLMLGNSVFLVVQVAFKSFLSSVPYINIVYLCLEKLSLWRYLLVRSSCWNRCCWGWQLYFEILIVFLLHQLQPFF